MGLYALVVVEHLVQCLVLDTDVFSSSPTP